MQKSIRKNVQVYIPIYLIPALERIAERNKWDLDYVVEEAFIHFLNEEHFNIKYTELMKTNPKKRTASLNTTTKKVIKPVVKSAKYTKKGK